MNYKTRYKYIILIILILINLLNIGFMYKAKPQNTTCHLDTFYSSNNPEPPISTLPQKEDLTTYNGNIEHLCFTTLIAFPEKAFNEKNHLRSHYDSTKITATEFNNILSQLYKNDYIIIDINDIFNIENNTITKKELLLPANKKPLLFSFDNVTYISNYQNLGEIDKLIIDRNNQLASYTTKKSVQDRICYDNEFILILEKFISSHPDFSYNNARGIIFLTGENGILGYNTSHKNASYKFETKRVAEVIKRIKSMGWKFGSNGYSLLDISNLSDMEFAKNLSLWNKEIKTIIGDTPYYAHPYNCHNEISSTKKELLYSNNYKIFFENNCETGSEIFKDIAILKRTCINGETLRSDNLTHLFDTYKVYDHTNRHILFNKKTSEDQ